MGNSAVNSRNEGDVKSTSNRQRRETDGRVCIKDQARQVQFLEQYTRCFTVSTNATNQQGRRGYHVGTETTTTVTTNHLLFSLQNKPASSEKK